MTAEESQSEKTAEEKSDADKQAEIREHSTTKPAMEFVLGFIIGLALIVVLLWKMPQFLLVFAAGGLLLFGLIWLLFKILL